MPAVKHRFEEHGSAPIKFPVRVFGLRSTTGACRGPRMLLFTFASVSYSCLREDHTLLHLIFKYA